MSALDNLPPASFDGLSFPVVERTAELSTRYHTHEFWKMAGGKNEKGGRKVWEFTFLVPFHDTMADFPDLYPGTLDTFTKKAEDMSTGLLMIPEIGSIRAFIGKLSRKRTGKITSGEEVQLHFVEDDLLPFAKVSAQTVKATFQNASVHLIRTIAVLPPQLLADARAQAAPKSSLFDLLNDLIDAVSAVKDQSELYGNLFAAKLAKLSSLLKAIHQTIAFLKNPEFHQVGKAVRDLWTSVHVLQTDLHSTGKKTVPYTVPQTMSVSSIALSIYNDGTRGGEILSLNGGAIKNPYAVPAATQLQVYQAVQ